jgi:hypothetical protein
MREELTAENNGFGLVTATMRCTHCQQWHEVQRVGVPYTPLMFIVIFFFLLQASESPFLLKFILGVVNLAFALQRWLWPSDSPAPPAMPSPSKAAYEPVVQGESVKNFVAWLDDVSSKQRAPSDRPDNASIEQGTRY